MRKMMLSAAMLGAMLVPLLHSGPADALNGKSWVRNSGSDGLNCSDWANACRTLGKALSVTVQGGEIGIIDAGDYGQLSGGSNIIHSISIVNDDAGDAGLLNINGSCPGGTLMFISASPGDVISLRGLVFEGCVSGVNGIIFQGGSALHIQNSVFKNFEGGSILNAGLVFQPSGNSQLFVSNTILFNNGSVANTGGILVQPLGSGSASVVLDRVHLENNVVGLRLDAATNATGGNGIRAVVRDSVASGNAGDGISVFTTAGKPFAFAFVNRSEMVNNGSNGILANGPHATVLLRDSVITKNGTGVSAINTGQIITYGNNANNSNIGAEGVATSTFVPF